MKQVFLILEKIFVVTALLLFTGAFLVLQRDVSGTEIDAQDGDQTIQIVFLLIYVITFFLSIVCWRRIVMSFMSAPILWALVLMACLSTFWSEFPALTLRRSFALIGTTYFGIYLASRYATHELLYLLAWTFGIAAVLSLLFGIFLPSYGIESDLSRSYYGAWRGIFLQKNHLGRMMSLGTWVFLLLGLTNLRIRYRLILFSLCGLCACLLLLSTSKTALIVLCALFPGGLLLLVSKLQSKASSVVYSGLALMLSTLVGVFLLLGVEYIETLVGTDILTFTGRTTLWSLVYGFIVQRPLLGYGYGGFWSGWEGPAGQVWVMLPSYEWYPGHGHNGYLDIIADLGLIGLVLFAIGFYRAFNLALLRIPKLPSVVGVWPALYLIFVFIYSSTETIILVRNNIFWVLYVATVLTLSIDVPIRARHSKWKLPRHPEIIKEA